MKSVGTLAFILTVIGAINWGLVGLMDFDLVAALLGDRSAGARLVYILVGLSGLGSLVTVLPRLSKS